MYPTEPARELSQYFVSDPELIPKIKTALRKVNGGPQDPSLNPLTGKPPVWRIPILRGFVVFWIQKMDCPKIPRFHACQI